MSGNKPEPIDKDAINVNEISSKEEAEKVIAIAEQKKVELHLKEEEKRIKGIKCSCGKSLKINPKEFMMKGSKAKKIECSKCSRLTRIQIQYPENPEICKANIKVKSGQYTWETESPSKLSDKNIKKWLEEEEIRIKNNNSRFPKRDDQILVRAINLSLKK